MRAKGRSPTSAIAPPASIENHAAGQSSSRISMKLLGCQQSLRISRLNESEKAAPEGNRFPLSNVTGTCTWPRTMEAGQRSAGESLQQTMCSPSTDKRGGLNGSTLHSSRTRLALKTKAKSLARVRSAGTLPWLGFDRGQPNRSLLPRKHCRINALDGVASTV